MVPGDTVGGTVRGFGAIDSRGDRIDPGAMVVVGPKVAPGAGVAAGAIVTATTTKAIATGEKAYHKQN